MALQSLLFAASLVDATLPRLPSEWTMQLYHCDGISDTGACNPYDFPPKIWTPSTETGEHVHASGRVQFSAKLQKARLDFACSNDAGPQTWVFSGSDMLVIDPLNAGGPTCFEATNVTFPSGQLSKNSRKVNSTETELEAWFDVEAFVYFFRGTGWPVGAYFINNNFPPSSFQQNMFFSRFSMNVGLGPHWCYGPCCNILSLTHCWRGRSEFESEVPEGVQASQCNNVDGRPIFEAISGVVCGWVPVE
jgi:hypothetical protein